VFPGFRNPALAGLIIGNALRMRREAEHRGGVLPDVASESPPHTTHEGNPIKFHSGQEIPLELHKVRVVQKLHLRPIERRKQAMEEAGFNTFLLTTKDVFLDMLTDSGTNAMSDQQLGSMMVADDAYAGSASFTRMQDAVREVFGMQHILPVHQGRAAENIISKTFIKPGDVVPMNYHFTTTKAHIDINGGQILEIYTDEALKLKATARSREISTSTSSQPSSKNTVPLKSPTSAWRRPPT
jgi:hypothetical protein